MDTDGFTKVGRGGKPKRDRASPSASPPGAGTQSPSAHAAKRPTGALSYAAATRAGTARRPGGVPADVLAEATSDLFPGGGEVTCDRVEGTDGVSCIFDALRLALLGAGHPPADLPDQGAVRRRVKQCFTEHGGESWEGGTSLRELLRTTLRLRLGLPIRCAAGKEANVDGVEYDRHGDVASVDPLQGHSTRHTGVLHLLAEIFQSLFSKARVLLEPLEHGEFSPGYRPDLVFLSLLGSRTGADVGDVKILSPIAARQESTDLAGTQVGFGNTLSPITEKMIGTRARGEEGDPPFDPATGNGRVKEKSGDYKGALALGHKIWVLLFETFGGFGPDVMKLLKYGARCVGNKLSRGQYDETTWGARTWMSFQMQRISVKLHKAVAFEVNAELGHPIGPLE